MLSMRVIKASFFGLPFFVCSDRYASTFFKKWLAAESGTNTVASTGPVSDG